MGKFKDKVYDFLVRKNPSVQYEYERYVMEHTIEHYENRMKHWKILFELNWHYLVRKKNEPMLYFDNNKNYLPLKKENQKIAQVTTQSKVTSSPSNTKPRVVTENKTIFSHNNQRTESFYLAKTLSTYDVISFDIFDTLLFRAVVNPEDVFILVGEKLGLVDFVQLRRDVEKKLRDQHRLEYGNHEITLLDIYSEIERRTGINANFGMECEIEVEKSLIYPNPYMKQVYDMLRGQGKYIIAVSDMYLSQDVINSLLTQCGYVVDDLFVSCEYHCNKRGGGLYLQVLEKYKNKRIVHVGDNYEADIVKAREIGLDAIFYRKSSLIGREMLNVEGMSELVGSAYKGLVYNTLFNGANKFNPYFEYGYIFGGLYVVGFCNWIKEQAQKEEVTKILFLARDGDIYQKVFNMLNVKIDNEYIYWSRIASIIANLETEKNDFLKRLVDHKAVSVIKTKVSDVLETVGVTESDIKLNDYGLTAEMVLCPQNKVYLEKAFSDNYEIIIEKNKCRLEQIERMLRKCIGENKKVAVVDVGWTGSSVLSIKNLVENKYKMDCKVHCYLSASKVKGNLANITSCMDGTLETYMFSQIFNRDLYDYHVSANKGSNSIYFELFTQACMPSFAGISNDGKYNFDIPEVENYEMISEIHRGILAFAKQYISISEKNPTLLRIPGNDAYRPYKFISANLGYIKHHFSDFTYARGVGSNDEMKIESIKNILDSLKL